MAHKPRYGVEPVNEETEGLDPPYCPHGPTLVFERFYADREPRRFFACAVHRDRKGCPFFHWVDEHLSVEKRQRGREEFEVNNLPRSGILARVQQSPARDRCFCYECGTVMVREKLRDSEHDEHKGHKMKMGISDIELQEPSKLLAPVDDNKGEAQFFFTRSVTQFLISELKRLGFSAVLCVGTPSLHEALAQLDGTSSLLLDIDHRYAQFYPPEQYQRFNMFNCFFYESGGLELCQSFLQSSESVAVVIDPPFGGLAHVLAQGIDKIYQLARKELPTLLVFPYFMEAHVCTALPSFHMSDYQVMYRNHKHFSDGHRKKPKPSPVRIFTNLPPPGLQLPSEENYRFCKVCSRYISSENFHCEECNACTSKDGRRYRHCYKCGVCVKPGRVHCEKCGRCELPVHTCGEVAAVGCHACGSLEHKRKDCPEKGRREKSQDIRVQDGLRKRKGKSTGTKPKKPKLH